jgi:hypothetical protein
MNKITWLKKFRICIIVTLSLWQMASDKTTPTASGIGAGFPLRAEGEASGEGSETHLPAPSELRLDLSQVLATKPDSLRSSLEVWRINARMVEDHKTG